MSIVTRLLSGGPRKRGLIPRRDKEFFLLALTGSVAEPASYSVDAGGKATAG